MAELKLFVEISVPDIYVQYRSFENTYKYIEDSLQELAEGLEGSVTDVEIK